MLTIEQLSLQLPAGFEDRSEAVLRLMAEELARLPMEFQGRLDGLQLPPIEMQAHWDDRQLARHIAHAIHDSARSSLQYGHRQDKGGRKP
jgi:hypothetical protein